MKRLYDEPAAYTTADIANALMEYRNKKLPVRPSFFNALVPQVSAQNAAINRPDPVERASLFPLATYPDGSTRLALPGMIAEDIPRAFTAPARAYRGEIPDEDMISEGLNFAGNMAMGGSVVPKPTNTAGMFGGRLTGSTESSVARSLDTDIARQIHEAQRAANPVADPNRLAQIARKGNEWEVSSPVGNIVAYDVPQGVQIKGAGLDEGVPRGMGYGMPLYETLANEAAASGKPMLSDKIVSQPAQNAYGALSRRGYDVSGPPPRALRHPDSGSLIANAMAEDPVYSVSAPNVAPREMPPPLPDILYGNGKQSALPGAVIAEAGQNPLGWSEAAEIRAPWYRRVFGDNSITIRGYRGSPSTAQHWRRSEDPVFASSNPDVATSYAMEPWRGMQNDAGQPNVTPLDFRFSNPYIHDARGKSYLDVGHGKNTDDLAEMALEKGHDGILIRNVVDNPTQDGMTNPQTTIAALRRGTVYSGTTGELLFENGASASAPGAIASEAARQHLPVKMDVPFYRGSAHGQTSVDYSQPYWGTTDRTTASDYAKSRSGMYFRDGTTPNVTPAVARFRDPLYIDAQNAGWSEIPFEGQKWNSDKLAEVAKERGHDGLVIDRLYDEGKFDEAMGLPATVAALRPGTVSSAFDPNNILYANSKSSGVPGALIAEAADKPRGSDDALIQILQRYGLTR